MGTEVLLPSKGFELLFAGKVTLGLYQQPVIILKGPEEEKQQFGLQQKITSEWLHGPRGQRHPRSMCGCSCWWGFQGTKFSVSAPAWGDRDLPRLSVCSPTIPWHLSKFSPGARVF